MQIRTCLHAGVTATAIAATGIVGMAAAPLAPVTQSQSPPTAAQDVRLAAATVPPGGLITSFLGNQLIYCSLICPLLVQTAVIPVVTTLQTPGTFLIALQSGDLLKAIGATAASVTGPTNAAAEAAIVTDGAIPAKRALNAFEVGVVGLLDIVPAAAGGLPGIVTAIQAFRQDTFTALNLPIEPNPLPTVMPHGVVQVAVVGALNVVGAIIFPAFNHILSAAFETPDAVAQELAATGDPVRAVAAGVNTAAGEVTAAVTDVADSVVTAVNSIRAASGQSLSANRVMQAQNSAATTTPSRAKVEPPQPMVTTTTKHPNAALGSSHPLRDAASNVRQIVRSVIKKTAGGTAGQSGSGGTTLGGTKGKHGANGDNGASGSNGRGGTARKHG